MSLNQSPEVLDFLKKHAEPKRSPDELGRLGKFQLRNVLGIGGMGIVFQAQDLLLRRDVALKVLLPEKIGNETARKQFLHEARAAANIKHDNVMPVLDANVVKDVIFIVMPYLAGGTVRQRVQRTGPVSAPELLQLAHESAMGLAAAHAKQILHRDISPNNLWLERRGDQFRTLLLDFGLAKVQNVNLLSTKTYQSVGQAGKSTLSNAVQAKSTIQGTVGYMAPEQFEGKTSVQSDLFSLGATLFHAATGTSPFSGANRDLLAINNWESEPIHIATLRSELPKPLQDLIMKLISRKAEQRPVSAAQVVQACEQMGNSKQPIVPAQPAPAHLQLQKTEQPDPLVKEVAKLSRLNIALVGSAVLLILCLVAFLLFQKGDSRELISKETAAIATETGAIVEGDLVIDFLLKKVSGATDWISLTENSPKLNLALPVVAGDSYYLKLSSKKPVCAYIVRINNNSVTPLYPWKEKTWEVPEKEEKVTELRFPKKDGKVWSIEGNQDSLETVLAWVFTEPQPQLAEHLGERLKRLPVHPAKVHNLQTLMWCYDGELAPDPHPANKRSGTESSDTFLELQSAIKAIHKDLRGHSLSVTLARQGSVAAVAPGAPARTVTKTPTATASVSRAIVPEIIRNNPYHRPLGEMTFDRLTKLSQCLPQVNRLTEESGMLLNRKEFEAAKVKCEEAVSLLKTKLGDTDPLADIPSNILSLYYMSKDQKPEAEKHALLFLSLMKQLSEIRSLPNFKNGYYLALINLASVYLGSNRPAEAEVALMETLEILKREGNKDNKEHAQILAQLAGAYFHSGKFEDAEKFARQSYDMYQRLFSTAQQRKENASDLANIANSMGLILNARGKLDDSKRYLEEFKAISSGTTLPPDTRALSLQNSAFDCIRRGGKEEALALYQQAYDLFCSTYPVAQFPNGHSNIALCAALYGDACAACGISEKARTLLTTSVEMCKKLYSPSMYPVGQRETAHSLYYLGMFYFRERDVSKAQSLLVESMELTTPLLNRTLERMTEADARFFVEAMPYNLYTLLTMNQAYDPQLHALQFKSKAIVTREMEARRNRLAILNDPEANKLSEQLESVRQKLAVIANSSDSGAVTRESLRDLETNKDLLEKQLARQLADRHLARAATPIEPAELTHLLHADTAFIDFTMYARMTGERERLFHVGNYHYLAYVMLPGFTPVRVELGPAENINQALETWLTDVRRQGNIESERQKASKLAALLFDPLRRHLGTNVKHLYLSPDSWLHQVPWSALPGSTPDKMLLHDYSVSTVPHGSFLAEQLKQPDRAAASEKFLVMGGLDYGTPTPPRPPFRYLPGTEQECAFILKLINRIRSQTALNRVKAKTYSNDLLADLSQARLAHLATHGYFDDPAVDATRGDLLRRYPMTLSGLALTDANQSSAPGSQAHVLTAEQIVGKDLSNLDLVVLSACDTGLGEMTIGEGNLGLQRAFHIAGSRHTMTALWKVPDSETAALMSLFYRNLLVKNLPVRKALHYAQLELLHRPEVVQELSTARVDATLDQWVRDGTQSLNFPDSIPHGIPLVKTSAWAGFVLSGK